MKLLPLIALFFLCLQVSAQSLEGYAGLGFNRFYDFNYDAGHYHSDYEKGLAKRLGIGLFGKTNLGLGMGLTLQYTEIEGGIKLKDDGLAAGFELDGDAKLRTVELGLFPLNLGMQIKPLKGTIEILMGMEFGLLVGGSLEGKETNWQLDFDHSSTPPNIIYNTETRPINTETRTYFTNLNASLCLKLGYSLPIGKKLELIPRLHLGYGLTKRFTYEVDSRPKNRNSILEVSLRRALN